MSAPDNKADGLSAKFDALIAATTKAFADLKAYSAPVLPTVELPDRISAWSYDIFGRGDYSFTWYLNGQRIGCAVGRAATKSLIEDGEWQTFWDDMFAKSIARADEVTSWSL